MNPHQKNKIDVSSLSAEEQRLFRIYGKLPSRTDRLAKHLKERKYFDSGDYALSKAGKANSVDTGAVGSEHPLPENIPHLSSPVGSVGVNNGVAAGSAAGSQGGAGHGLLHAHTHLGPGGAGNAAGGAAGPGGGAVPLGAAAGSPVKESSFLHRGTSVDELEDDDDADKDEEDAEPAKKVPASGPGSKEAIPIRR